MVNKPINHAKGSRKLACLEVAMENGIIAEHDVCPEDNPSTQAERMETQLKSERETDNFFRAWKILDFTVPMGMFISSAISS